jgi:hypothetical protein
MASGRLPWRRGTGPSPGSDLSGVTQLDLINVTLVTEVDGQPAEVPLLALAFDETGMTVKKSDGTRYVRIPWTSIVRLSADVVRPGHHDGGTAVELEVHSDRKQHHFLVPDVQPAALKVSLDAMSARYGGGVVVAPEAKRGHRR